MSTKIKLILNKLIFLPFIIIGLFLYAFERFEIVSNVNYNFLFSLFFSFITLPSIIKTIFGKERQNQIKKSNKYEFYGIILMITFSALIFYSSILLGFIFCILLLGFHFGENDLKLKTQYIWNLSYGVGLIGIYISWNWTEIIKYIGNNNLITEIQFIEMKNFEYIIQKTLPFSILLFVIGVFMSWKIKRNYHSISLFLIPVGIFGLSSFSFLFIYLFLWKPLIESTDKKNSTAPLKLLLYKTIGLSVGLVTYFIFGKFSAEQTIILTFTGISFLLPYVLKKHEEKKVARRTELFRKLTLRRELNLEREHIEVYNWEINLLNKIHTSSIKYKEPKKL